MRPGGGQNGRQTCNACRAIVVQANVRKRAAKSSIQRLQSVRETLRRRHILRETWEAIAEHRKKQTRCARTSNQEATNEVATEKEIDQAMQVPPATPQQELYVYTCPFCQGSVTTSTASGHINHRRVCGKQFRVQDGLLRPTLPTIRYSHTCPTCGTCVQSTKKFGRIQSKHKQPSGRMCHIKQWHAS